MFTPHHYRSRRWRGKGRTREGGIENLSIFITIPSFQTFTTPLHTFTSPRINVDSFSNLQPHTDASKQTCISSTGHGSMPHCESCCCRNGNFNEVSTAMEADLHRLVRENGTLFTLSKNGPVILLKIEAKTPVNNSLFFFSLFF